MSIQANITDSVRVAGLNLSESVQLDSDGASVQNVALAAAEQASAWIRNTATTGGVLTMGTGHTQTTAKVVDLYWKETINGKLVQKGRRGVILGTVAGDQVPVTASGAGDSLPAESTSLVITVADRVELDLEIAGDQVCLAAFSTKSEGAFSFTEVDLAEDFGRTICAGCVWKWYQGNSEVNPLAGKAITNVIVSQGSTTAGIAQVAVQYNNA